MKIQVGEQYPWKQSLHAHYWSSSNPPYPIHPLPPFPGFFYLLLLLFSHVFFILPLLCFSTHYCVVICTLGLEIVGFAITLQLKVLTARGLLKRGWNHKNLGIFFEFLKHCRDLKWKPYQWKVQWISQKVNNIPFQPTLSTDYARVFCIYSS